MEHHILGQNAHLPPRPPALAVAVPILSPPGQHGLPDRAGLARRFPAGPHERLARPALDGGRSLALRGRESEPRWCGPGGEGAL